jgi:hypothetical protein
MKNIARLSESFTTYPLPNCQTAAGGHPKQSFKNRLVLLFIFLSILVVCKDN